MSAFDMARSRSAGRMTILTRMAIPARISYLYPPYDENGDFPSYIARGRDECRDAVDRSAYDALMARGEHTIVIGKICVERLILLAFAEQAAAVEKLKGGDRDERHV